jgi:hypothetical protein
MMHDLGVVSLSLSVTCTCRHDLSWTQLRTSTYSKPICECTTKSAQKTESITGFSDPAANGARVSGIRPAETILCYISHAQDTNSTDCVEDSSLHFLSLSFHVELTHLSKLQW